MTLSSTLSPSRSASIRISRDIGMGTGAQRLSLNRLAIVDRVFDEIGERLADQLAIAVQWREGRLDAQGHAIVFRQRLVELMNAVGHFGGIEIVHIVAGLARLRARKSSTAH